MSTDKLKNLVASDIEFVTGERLKAEKLNYLIQLLETNINHLGAAVGDIYDENVSSDLKERSEWGKQFDSNIPATGSQKRRFDIANLARLIGPASNLNPQALRNVGEFINIRETIPEGIVEYTLKYPKSLAFALNINEYTTVVNKESLTGEMLCYIENNTIYFSTPTSTSIEITYQTDPRQYNGGPNYQGASFNVYPDPNQIGLENKLTVNYTVDLDGNVSYTIILPTIQNQQGSFADNFETTSLDNRDINFDAQLMWPGWIQDLADNSIIPSYSLYLKNYTLNESYLDATYTKISNTEILVTNLQIGDQECINEFDLRVVTVGTDITTSIDDLRNKMFLHKHDGSFGEPKININNIVGFYETEAPSGPYYPSSANWNPLSGYLHRDGYQANSDIVNGDNAMRGPLMMGLTNFDPITNKQIVDFGSQLTSYPLYFGNESLYIAREDTEIKGNNHLTIKNDIGGVSVTGEKYVNLNETLLLKKHNSEVYYNEAESNTANDSILFRSKGGINYGLKYEYKNLCTLKMKNPGQFYHSDYDWQDSNEQYLDMFDIYNTGDVYGYLESDGSLLLNQNFPSEPYEKAKRFFEIESNEGTASILSFEIDDENSGWIWPERGTIKIASNVLNTNYYLKLYYDYPNAQVNKIISPLFYIIRGSTVGQRQYRPIDITIDRGQAWWSHINSLGLSASELKNYSFEIEYTINIDYKLMSLLPNVDFYEATNDYYPRINLNYNFIKDNQILNSIYTLAGSLSRRVNPNSFFNLFDIKTVIVNNFGKHMTLMGGDNPYNLSISAGVGLDVDTNINSISQNGFNNLGDYTTNESDYDHAIIKYGGNRNDGSVSIAKGIKVKETLSNGIFFIEVL